MGLEITGFTKPNLQKLWVDPYDYQDELTAAVEYLSIRGMSVSIYNHVLCVYTPADMEIREKIHLGLEEHLSGRVQNVRRTARVRRIFQIRAPGS